MSTKVDSLTKGGIRQLFEMENSTQNLDHITLQVIQIKIFEEKKEKEKKNAIKQRLVLSDGVSSCIVMIDSKRYNKMAETGDLPQLNDIVQITRCTVNEVNNRKLLILNEPLSIIYNGLKDKLGSPKDYSVNLKKGTFPEDDTDIKLPSSIVKKGILSSESKL